MRRGPAPPDNFPIRRPPAIHPAVCRTEQNQTTIDCGGTIHTPPRREAPLRLATGCIEHSHPVLVYRRYKQLAFRDNRRTKPTANFRTPGLFQFRGNRGLRRTASQRIVTESGPITGVRCALPASDFFIYRTPFKTSTVLLVPFLCDGELTRHVYGGPGLRSEGKVAV